MKSSRVLPSIFAAFAVLAIAIYFLNPLGIPTWDPRGRLLGVIPYRLPSDSMAPTITRGSLLIACTGSYLRAAPAVGDIIVFRAPPPMSVPYVKRVVAIAGDSVSFSGSRFLRNQLVQSEPYIDPNHRYDELALQVPAGTVFVAGDNREHSLDSRHFGPLPTSAIIGKVCRF